MITHLSIRGLAIIEELRIDFSPQLNVITGETGAGKSILIKALHLLLGVKADPDVIRSGFERAHVAASFLLPKIHPSVVLLREHSLIDDEQELCELIVRREISQKGRSQAWINDQLISSALLKEVGQSLIDIYGQHENHRMLDASIHMEYIDQFLKDPSLPLKLSSLISVIQSGMGDIRKSIEQLQLKKREQDFLQFRFDELSRFAPSHEDYEEVSVHCQKAVRSMAEQKILKQAQSLCDEGYTGRPLGSAVQDLLRTLEQSKWIREDKDFDASIHSLRDLLQALDDVSFLIERVANKNAVDEERIEADQERLAQYQSLFRKLGVRSIVEMMQEYDRLEKEISFVNEGPEVIEEKMRGILSMITDADAMARCLTDERSKAAQSAISTIEAELQDLNMKGAQIKFEFQNVRQSIASPDLQDLSSELQKMWAKCADFLTETGKCGRERGQFLLAANPGEGFKPLAKVASGGEISRIMLGFKKALAIGANTCVMVFDEIDTGISGQTAHIVGRKLKELSHKFQVICISHLPQVAAYGDAHFKVEKNQKLASTETRIYKLTIEESEKEVARLLSGDHVTPSSLTHAKQLKRAARI